MGNKHLTADEYNAGSQAFISVYKQVLPSAETVRLLGAGNYRRIFRTSGISPQHIARVVTGRKGASLHVAKRIAFAAGVSLDEMYNFIMSSPLLAVRGRHTMADNAAAALNTANRIAGRAMGANRLRNTTDKTVINRERKVIKARTEHKTEVRRRSTSRAAASRLAPALPDIFEL